MNRTTEDKIFGLTIGDQHFEQVALEVFRYQAQHCQPYRQYIELLGLDPLAVTTLEEVPCLPISLFRTHDIYTEAHPPQADFTSSGTTGNETSHHRVASLDLYTRSYINNFRTFYGDPSGWAIFALLPAYLERKGSSLTLMAEGLQAQNPTQGGFFLYDHQAMVESLELHIDRHPQTPVMILGVTFALVDFVEKHKMHLPPTSVVMETGGMKGRRREIERQHLHQLLCEGFGVDSIHSEYGMTELLSQAYSKGNGLFETPYQMRVMPRNLLNPLGVGEFQKPQGLNIIDLANLYSCAFIATEDLGIVHPNQTFEILGRIEGRILRGCNMLTE